MAEYHALGNLQKDILVTIACSPKLLVTNQIAKILKKDQTTVFKSVDSLIANGCIEPEREEGGIKKYLKLTDKGVCYVIWDGNQDYEMILENHPYLRPFYEVELIKKLITNRALRHHIYRDIALNALDNDEFIDTIRHWHSKISLSGKYRILQSIRFSIQTYHIYGVNRTEINRFIDEVRDSFMQSFKRISEEFDRFDMLDEEGQL